MDYSIGGLLWVIIFVVICVKMASTRHRSVPLAVIAAILFGPFAIIYYYFAGDAGGSGK